MIVNVNMVHECISLAASVSAFHTIYDRKTMNQCIVQKYEMKEMNYAQCGAIQIEISAQWK